MTLTGDCASPMPRRRLLMGPSAPKMMMSPRTLMTTVTNEDTTIAASRIIAHRERMRAMA